MQLQSLANVRPVPPRPTPKPSPTPAPGNPEVRALARTMLIDARDAVQAAIVATSASDRMDPSLPFWTHTAVAAIGRAGGFLQAVEATKSLTKVAVPLLVYVQALDDARRTIVDAASAVQAGRPADPAAFAAANATLRGLIGQFNFDIAKHNPVPTPIEPTPKYV